MSRDRRMPPEVFDLGDGVELRRARIKDARAQATAVAENIEHLRPWMPWIAFEPLTLSARRELLRDWNRQWAEGEAFQYGVFDQDGPMLGGGGLMARLGPGELEVGYWLAASAQGRGLATELTRVLTVTALELADIHVVRLRHDKGNVRSGAVPARLGFEYEGETQREITAPAETGVTCTWRLDATRAVSLVRPGRV